MTRHLLDKVDLEDVLAKFSIRGRYHVVSGVWLTLAIAVACMWYSNYVLIAEEIKYSCANSNSTFNNVSVPSYFSNEENATTAKRKDAVTCAQWIYENPDSFVAEFQLAGQEWKRILVGTANVFGNMIGFIILGPLSDRFGRRKLAIVAGTIGALCGLTKSFTTIYWIYIAIEILEATLGDSYLLLYVLGLEMVPTNSRATYMTACSMGLVMGGISFPLIKWGFPYWRTCLRVMYAPGLLYILLIYLLDESPRWLLTNGKLDIAMKNIEKAAKINKIEIEENLTQLSCEEDMSASFKKVIADTFSSKLLLKRFFICATWWFTCVFVNHGLLINSVLLEGNRNVNFALSFGVRLPSNIVAAYVLNKFTRKGTLISCFIALALICAGHPFIPNNILWLVITMYMFSKLIAGVSVTVLYIFTSELFPTYTRNSMEALCSSIGRIGGMIGTQMPLLMAYWSGLPLVLFSATSLISAFVTLFVPDTSQSALPDTVHQAEALDALVTRTPHEERSASLHSRNNDTSF